MRVQHSGQHKTGWQQGFGSFFSCSGCCLTCVWCTCFARSTRPVNFSGALCRRLSLCPLRETWRRKTEVYRN